MPTQTEAQRRQAYQDAGVAYNPPSTLSSENLSGSQPDLNLPNTPQEPNYAASLQSIITAMNQTTPQEVEQSGLQKSITDSLTRLEGKSAAQLQAENQAGLPQFNTQLTDVNNQIQSLQKEALAIPLQIQEESRARGRTVGGIQPLQTGQLRQNAIRSLGLSAIAQTLQGNIANAQAQADRAVELEFAPLEARLTTLAQSYQFNKDALERVDKKRADQLKILIDERTRVLGEQKADRKYSSDIALLAAQSGAPQSVVEKMRNATPDEAIGIGATYLGAEFRQKAAQQAFDNKIALRSIAVAESNAALTRKKTLIDLAKDGDADAIAELGYDPNNLPLTPEKLKNYEDQKSFFNRDIEIAKRASNNWVGLEASSGLIRGGFAGAFLESPVGPLSAPYSAAKKNDFLADAGYIVKNLTFDKIKELSDKGIKLTPISEKELKAMGDASSVLVSSAEFDENGNLKGFRISEDRVRQLLTDVETHYQNAVDDINVNMVLTPAERKELLGL